LDSISDKNFAVSSRWNFLSPASMHRKNLFRLASANRGIVEERVIRHRQPVERQHSKNCGQSGDEDRQLESHGNERRPAVQRAASNV
jgi:hypothetical protein